MHSELAKESLEFLINDYNFHIKSETDCFHIDEAGGETIKIITYNNNEIEIEFAFGTISTMIHFDIRKIMGNKPVSYDDEIYCVSREELMKLTNDRRMDNWQLSYSETLNLLKELLINNLTLFLNGNWLNQDLINKKAEYKYLILKECIDDIDAILNAKNFTRIRSTQPSYITYYMNKNILYYKNGEKRIEIHYGSDYIRQFHVILVLVNGEFYKGCTEGDFRAFITSTLKTIVEN
jgi:hypothetical protein